ncbi:MAG: SIS domain-containing protein [Nanoarchaeota archaeon]|nr:SIS domain-containing protein [Nanoarchaeota archaeon]
MISEDAENLNIALKKTLDLEKDNLEKMISIGLECLSSGGKILACGNGGSASQAQHFAAELVVRLKKNRKALPSIALTTDTSILTACSNDYSFDKIFSRQIEALANEKDILLCLSTSGNSANVVQAALAAKEKGCKTVSFTGKKESELEKISDVTIKVQAEETSRIQEIHLFLIHFLAGELEKPYNE